MAKRHKSVGRGRNDLCPCGSGKLFKRCCLITEQAEKARQIRGQRGWAAYMKRALGFMRRTTTADIWAMRRPIIE